MQTETLLIVLSKMFGENIVRAGCQAEQLHGGTVGNVQLITGTAETGDGGSLPYKVVLKVQHKWERHGDPDSWRREYDLYVSDFGKTFTDSLRWPECYHAEMNESGDEWQLWLEYIDGVSGLDLNGEMYECAAEELGRFQGRLYAEQPAVLKSLTNLSNAAAFKNFYLRYKSWNVVYDYIRSDDCEIPGHLCKMIIDSDNNSDEIFERIERLPIVFCHRDFWVTNIFYSDGKIILIDWDTTGWGYIGEDILSLIADEADVKRMTEYYCRCVPAYRKGFSEYTDISHIPDLYIYERIVLHFGYRLIEWYLEADSPEDKAHHVDTLQQIYEMK